MLRKKLTLKQEKFVQKYLETGNATEAATQAYDVGNRNVARAMGAENLAKPAVQQEVQTRKGFSDETRAIIEAGLRHAIANARECLHSDESDVVKAARKDLIEASKLADDRTDLKTRAALHNHLHLPARS